MSDYATREEAIKWGLKHACVDTARVGYTMISEDDAHEWVELAEGRAKIRMLRAVAEVVFKFGPGWPRTIAALRDPVRAQAEIDEKERKQRAAELATLKRLKAKYESES